MTVSSVRGIHGTGLAMLCADLKGSGTTLASRSYGVVLSWLVQDTRFLNGIQSHSAFRRPDMIDWLNDTVRLLINSSTLPVNPHIPFVKIRSKLVVYQYCTTVTPTQQWEWDRWPSFTT